MSFIPSESSMTNGAIAMAAPGVKISDQDSSRTHLYIFTGPNDAQAADEAKRESNSSLNELESFKIDEVLLSACRDFEKRFSREVTVHSEFTTEDYHRLRRVFGIVDPPAIGISDVDLREREIIEVVDTSQNLMKFWKWGERWRALKDGRVMPKVERIFIEHIVDYGTDQNPNRMIEKLFHFIRHLHILRVDAGLAEVAKKIERLILSIGGKKLAKGIQAGKNTLLGN